MDVNTKRLSRPTACCYSCYITLHCSSSSILVNGDQSPSRSHGYWNHHLLVPPTVGIHQPAAVREFLRCYCCCLRRRLHPNDSGWSVSYSFWLRIPPDRATNFARNSWIHDHDVLCRSLRIPSVFHRPGHVYGGSAVVL